MIHRTNTRRRDRFLGSSAIPSTTPLANVTGVVHGASQVTVNFDGPVQPTGANPATWFFGATPRAVTGLVSSTPTQLVFSLSGTVAASDPYILQANDPAVRTPQGGFVAGKSGTMS
jgi:hypothetical protein